MRGVYKWCNGMWVSRMVWVTNKVEYNAVNMCLLFLLIKGWVATFTQRRQNSVSTWYPILRSGIATKLLECFLNVGPQRWERHCHNIQITLPELWPQNVATMFTQHCLNFVNVGPQHWGATLPQRSYNVAWKLSQCWSPTLVSNIATMLFQCSMVGFQHSQCNNIVTTLEH